MARKIIWTFESADDLESIATYIARDSGFYARSFVREIRDASFSLKEFPERGRMVPEFSNAAVRELFIKEYRLIYRIEESRICMQRTSSDTRSGNNRTAVSVSTGHLNLVLFRY